MAKRKQAYRGTPEQHTKDAVLLVQIMRLAAKNSKKAADAGRCGAALDFFAQAEAEAGAYAYAKGYSIRKHARRYEQGGLPTAAYKTLRTTKEHLAKKCFLKRF
jgi:hypothetical protein